MSQKLTDQEVEDLVQAMWALTVDDAGKPLEAETARGQMALEIAGKIVGAAIMLRLNPQAEVIEMAGYRKPAG